jgi:ParB family chromosome partitioning protein
VSDFELTAPPVVAIPHEKGKKKKSGNALHSSESVEYYTPAVYIEAARDVLGNIDLDPASCEEANRVVKARHYYTTEVDGLLMEWFGRVWLNPPYGNHPSLGTSNQGAWSERMFVAYRSKKVEAAIMLVNAVTDRVWFRPAWEHSICFTDHRIKFLTPVDSPDVHQPTHGNAFIYLGPRHDRFARRFIRFGPVVPPGAAMVSVLS